MNQNRKLLEQLLKNWAQDHDHGFGISSPTTGDKGVEITGSYFTWLIKQTDAGINLLELLDRLDLFMENKSKRKLDGMFCCKCQYFYQFAESNQEDGTLLCYSCRSNPYT